jgi:hypothetical protein
MAREVTESKGTIMRQVSGQETNAYAIPARSRVARVSPIGTAKLAWFIRVCGVLVLIAAMPRIMHEGWPHRVLACGSLAGIFNAILLFVMSFLYVTFGRTKLVVSVATMVLGLWVIVFSAAMLVLPHL